ncbi:MAG: NRDE family protein [Gammaproteobacteria bacterium]
MCFVAIAIDSHPTYPFVVAANRDELYERDAEVLHFWPAPGRFAAGKDLTGGGTWLGLSAKGDFAALTNCRSESRSSKPGLKSRGDLIKNFLTEQPELLDSLRSGSIIERSEYGGFNLIVGTTQALRVFSNADQSVAAFNTGIRAFSNHPITQPWPKTAHGEGQFQEILGDENKADTLISRLFEFLGNQKPYEDSDTPKHSGDLASRIQRTIFIAGETYGTRASTVILVDFSGQAVMTERTYGALGTPLSETSLKFEIEALR